MESMKILLTCLWIVSECNKETKQKTNKKNIFELSPNFYRTGSNISNSERGLLSN